MLTSVLLAALTTASIDPYAVFARTRDYWQSQHYPQKLQYTVAVTVVENGQAKTQRYAAGYDAEGDQLVVDAVSDQEKAHPFHPPGGFGVNTPLTGQGRPNPAVDYLGVPLLAPNYSFGIGVTPRGAPAPSPDPMDLVREIRAEFHDPAPRERELPARAANTPSPLREIAVVSTRTRNYDISFDGIETIGDAPAYHLSFRPVRDPGRYRLRELWVDEKSYAPRKLSEQTNFVTGPGTLVPWTVTFAQIDGATYVASETSLGSTKLGRTRYAQARIDFENIRPVDQFGNALSPFIPDDTLLIEEP